MNFPLTRVFRSVFYAQIAQRAEVEIPITVYTIILMQFGKLEMYIFF